MVEIFKTNVNKQKQAKYILIALKQNLPNTNSILTLKIAIIY